MRSFFLVVILFISYMAGFSQDNLVFDTIKLSLPDKNKGISVMQALNKRKTTRELSDKKLALQQLSELLWAANGVNREDGKRTAPAAMNKQLVDLYVVLQEGVFLYDAIKNQLIPVAKGDFRKETGAQEFVSAAAVNLVYIADLAKLKDFPAFAASLTREEKLKWGYIAAGCQSENVHIYCASEGLGAVVRGSVDSEKFGRIVKIRPEQVVLMGQTVGVVR
jgi:nitroreductase